VHHIAPSSLNNQTTQTTWMRRAEAISSKTVGAHNLWKGQTRVPASTASANHHHGDCETAIYIVGRRLHRHRRRRGGRDACRGIAGRLRLVPPWVPHREENPDPDSEAVVVIARTTPGGHRGQPRRTELV